MNVRSIAISAIDICRPNAESGQKIYILKNNKYTVPNKKVFILYSTYRLILILLYICVVCAHCALCDSRVLRIECAQNTGLAKIKQIAHILETGESIGPTNFTEQLSPAEIEAFKFAPITSCDIERTFSTYKRVLEDNRRSFIFESLMKHVIFIATTSIDIFSTQNNVE